MAIVDTSDVRPRSNDANKVKTNSSRYNQNRQGLNHSMPIKISSNFHTVKPIKTRDNLPFDRVSKDNKAMNNPRNFNGN